MPDIQKFIISINESTVGVSEVLDLKLFQENKIPYTYLLTLERGTPVVGKVIKYTVNFFDNRGAKILPKIGELTITFGDGQSGHNWPTAESIWLNVVDKKGNVIRLSSYSLTVEGFLIKAFQGLVNLKGVSDFTPLLQRIKNVNYFFNMLEFSNLVSAKDKVEKDKEPSKVIKNAEVNIATTTESADADEAFRDIIGLEHVKSEVRELIQIVKLRNEKIKRGLKYSPQTLHMAFTGNPGTGKTVVARLIAEEFKKIGVLEKGHIVEVDRSVLVEKYVGHTAKKTAEIIESAFGGVLFIDEAYSLVGRGEVDFGIEVIDTLVKFMEDYRDKFVLIVAGYPDKMKGFLDSNPGLSSRFYRTIHFEDYSPSEMIQIFKVFCKKSGYSLKISDKSLLTQSIVLRLEDENSNFGNARGVRKWFEEVERRQNLRVAKLRELSDSDLLTILDEDL